MGFKRAVLVSLAVGAGATCPAAFAQDDADDNTIIVTARKRAETLQAVPLAVSVVTGEEIARQGIEDSTDLIARVPSLYIATGSVNFPTTSNYQLTMRGVGFNAALEPAFGVFVDGMYEPHIAYDTAFLDAERVEVLRGPQGTLFGRNTQAGALNIVTRKPGEDVRGNFRAEYADFNSVRFSGAMSGPLGEDVFASVSAQYARTDGYIYNVTLDRDHSPSELLVARGVLRWTPADNLDISLIADASQRDFNEITRGVPLEGERYESISDEEENELSKTRGLQLNVDYELTPGITLTSITGVRQAYTDTWVDADGTPTPVGLWTVPATPPFTPNPVAVQGATLNVIIDQEFRSQEVRLAGEGGRFDWLAGVYYFDRFTDDDLVRFLGVGAALGTTPGGQGVYLTQDFWERREGYAGFGQVSFRPVERLELTLGGRYSEESVKTGGVRTFYLSGGTVRPPVFKDASETFDNFSWMGSLRFDLTDSVNTYFTYAEGWKAGGINRAPGTNDQVLPYDDEFSTTYELGLKSSFAANRLILNGAVFYIDLQDQQFSGFVPVPDSTPVLVVSNAGASKVEGVELELLARPSDNLQFSAAIAYNDTEFEEFVRIFSAASQFDMSGLDFEDVPELTGHAQLVYTTPGDVMFGGGLEFRLSYRYVDEVIVQDQGFGTDVTSQLIVPSYERWDGRVSLVREDGWRFTLFVDNIADSFDYTRTTSPAWQPNVAFGQLATPLEPRQAGFIVAKSF